MTVGFGCGVLTGIAGSFLTATALLIARDIRADRAAEHAAAERARLHHHPTEQ